MPTFYPIPAAPDPVSVTMPDSGNNFFCIDIGVLPNQPGLKYARREDA
jgi:hypothetical protein